LEIDTRNRFSTAFESTEQSGWLGTPVPTVRLYGKPP
jgi:hypothetical protein